METGGYREDPKYIYAGGNKEVYKENKSRWRAECATCLSLLLVCILSNLSLMAYFI